MFTILILILVSIIFMSYIIIVTPPQKPIEEFGILGAHRGSSVKFVENTLEAFEDAVNDDKYNFIEFDIQYTKDKVLIVHHDLSLLRLQKKKHKIAELTYDELLEISNYHIPTYNETMELVSGKKPLNIEIKSQGDAGDDSEIADFIIKDAEERGILQETLISSISQNVIFYINNKYNDLSQYYGDYPRYWVTKRKIHTGIIYFVRESTFSQNIPLLRRLSFLLGNSGLLSSIRSEQWISGADYLMIHGSNAWQYDFFLRHLPYNSRLAFWTFDDQMYLIMPPHNIWEDGYVEREYGVTLNEILPWWED